MKFSSRRKTTNRSLFWLTCSVVSRRVWLIPSGWRMAHVIRPQTDKTLIAPYPLSWAGRCLCRTRLTRLWWSCQNDESCFFYLTPVNYMSRMKWFSTFASFLIQPNALRAERISLSKFIPLVYSSRIAGSNHPRTSGHSSGPFQSKMSRFFSLFFCSYN